MNPTKDKKVSLSALGLLIIGILVSVIPALLNIGNPSFFPEGITPFLIATALITALSAAISYRTKQRNSQQM
ncbi:hypothetical protein ACT3TS_04285 [Specibacter sp. AOP5-B1-6]|uniref:hypothetical protein n=1 Tax=Specibacter sp. AOP5-B1-6 TaxID=3457653 RepID=UPI003FB8EBB0